MSQIRRFPAPNFIGVLLNTGIREERVYGVRILGKRKSKMLNVVGYLSWKFGIYEKYFITK